MGSSGKSPERRRGFTSIFTFQRASTLRPALRAFTKSAQREPDVQRCSIENLVSFGVGTAATIDNDERVMQLTKFQRELVSRAAAAALGLWLCYVAVGCFRWGEGLRTDAASADAFGATSGVRGRGAAANPIFLPYGLMVISGVAGLALAAFAVVPTSVIYGVNPRCWEESNE